MKVTPKADRRDHKRVEVVFGVRGSTDRGRVTLVNISEGGALVHAQAMLQVGDLCEFQFRVHDTLPGTVSLTARVVHIMPVPWFFNESYLVGVEFPPEQRARDANAIQRLIQTAGGPPSDL